MFPEIGRRIGKKTTIAAGVVLAASAVLGGVLVEAKQHPDQAADFLRARIGVNHTSDLEKLYFTGKDILDRNIPHKSRLTDPFGDNQKEVTELPQPQTNQQNTESPSIEPIKPVPLILPETKPLHSNLEQGEGLWTTVGLPHSSPDDMLMARTFIHPDPERPYATVGVLLLDRRRIKLHITGGVESPGGYRGVIGPGKIPDTDLPSLLVAWNGGWQGTHADFGMYADGKEYKPLRNGLASVVVMRDGTIMVGEWGRDFTQRTEDIVAIRQNAVLLVDNGEVSKRTNEGNDTWGYVYVNSKENITWRSAIGLTKNGDLLVAAGNNVSAATLARALWAAGAERAMNLDNNTPYVLAILAFKQPNGAIKTVKFMPSMFDSNTDRFLKPQQRNDFMFVTLDDSNFRPPEPSTP